MYCRLAFLIITTTKQASFQMTTDLDKLILSSVWKMVIVIIIGASLWQNGGAVGWRSEGCFITHLASSPLETVGSI